ncbi:DUF4863 family protein [Novosphingobium piscinae]|uniref:DUF4863 family protein n=1 Tax=Novosphingobium piscinae TaxID=1507448 RepID=A0A7X1FYF1_9SPHN|nr:DUF4863 family protein [Novosphingobium piscinae]MBC2669304.1 DUF4863 family protein [Novosphingobium piscinae]
MNSRPSTPDTFVEHLAEATRLIGDAMLDKSLEARLEAALPADGAWFAKAEALCRQGVAEGWLCGREAGGIKFGRCVPAGAGLGRFSVDVVEMDNVVGPHHAHPQGEIDLIIPLDDAAEFDGKGAGWMVYGPGSAHAPTVRQGKALVLYLLPDGAIAFTR